MSKRESISTWLLITGFLLGFMLVGAGLVGYSFNSWLRYDNSGDRIVTSIGSGNFVSKYLAPLVGLLFGFAAPGILNDRTGNLAKKMPNGIIAVIIWILYALLFVLAVTESSSVTNFLGKGDDNPISVELLIGAGIGGGLGIIIIAMILAPKD